jgi:hypothetical protein
LIDRRIGKSNTREETIMKIQTTIGNGKDFINPTHLTTLRSVTAGQG